MKVDAAGVDIGSRSIEVVGLRGGEIVLKRKVPTTFDPLRQCRLLLAEFEADVLVATGYGRKLFVETFPEAAGRVDAVTEIQAYGLGARAVAPQARTVLDIGGQDTKVIALNETGKILKFEMNDRCAAGTGKFLEFMATALQVPLEDFGPFALRADRRVVISSMCAVFAETEATSLMARGEKAENIALGLHLAIVGRVAAMLGRVGLTPPLLFAGGVARNPCVVELLRVRVPEVIATEALHGQRACA